jgi:hypothetical protein
MKNTLGGSLLSQARRGLYARLQPRVQRSYECPVEDFGCTTNLQEQIR